MSFEGGRQTHFHQEINVYETHSSTAGVKPRRDLDDSRRNEGGKERQEKKGEKENQCGAEASISFVMVTKCSGALTDGTKALYPPLYLRGPGSDITEIYDVYVTVTNEKRSEKTLERFLSLSVYQSTNSEENHACRFVCFVFFVNSQFIHQHRLVAEP